MISRLLKKLTVLALLAGALVACGQFSIPNPANSSNASLNAASSKKSYGKARGGRYQGRKPDPTASMSINDPTPVIKPVAGSTGNIWDRLRGSFQIPDAENQPAVQSQINWFMHNQGYLDRTVSRAAPFMFYIFSQTQERNIPAELVLLPVIESAYNPLVSSPKGAAGLWQLMPGTASGWGVKQDFWYDGRRDIFASTNAALDYLTYLQNYFGGDWLLAIAAYDTGEGNVQSAVRRNAVAGRDVSFWNLALANETRSYVPRLLALAAIIKNPGRYGITLPPISDTPYLMQVDIGAPINLAQAAKLAGMSLGELKELNPGYHRMTTDPNGPYKLILPINRIALFKEQLSASSNLASTKWQEYTVRSGDTLDSIAQRFGTTVSKLRESNQLNGYAAPVGKEIMIPKGTEAVVPQVADDSTDNPLAMSEAADQTSDNTDSDVPNPASTANAAAQAITERSQQPIAAVSQVQQASSSEEDNTADDESDRSTEAAVVTHPAGAIKREHTVRSGETLYSIARTYHVTPTQIQHWNNISSNRVRPGTKLVIWSKTTPANASAPAGHKGHTTGKTKHSAKSQHSGHKVAKA